MAEANRDQNHVPVALGQSSADATVTLPFKIDSTTGRVLTDSASGGATFTQETPVGTVNGSNNVFTVSNTPIFIVVDGIVRVSVASISDLGGNGYTYSGGTITVNSLVPPTSFIRSYYNA